MLVANLVLLRTTTADATSSCTGTITYEFAGYDTLDDTQPSGHRYEGILSTPTYYEAGTPCVGYGQLGQDGSIDAAWVGLGSQDSSYLAQVGIAFDPETSEQCFREFYESFGTYGHDDVGPIWESGCINAAGSHTLEVRMTTRSGCHDQKHCVQLLIDGTQYFQTYSDPITEWALPLRVKAFGEVNDDNSDVPGYVCCQGVVYPFDYDGTEVQEWTAGWKSTCGGYISWTQVSQNSRFSTGYSSYNCGNLGGSNRVQLWTNADS